MSRHTRAIEADTAHRPWPLPRLPWVMYQSWRDLLFAHWPVPASTLRRLVPSALSLDTCDGSGWVGLTPFRLVDLRPRGLPPLPGLSTFPEMNFRTYVRFQGTPGIFFFSLDAASRLAVWGARAGYALPYRLARMAIGHEEGWIRYESRRADDSAEFAGRYRPVGPATVAQPGSLEHFLVERYVLFSVLRGGTVLRGDVHHAPWQLQSAEAEVVRNTVPAAHGLTLPALAPLLHYARRQDTLVWPPRRGAPER